MDGGGKELRSLLRLRKRSPGLCMTHHLTGNALDKVGQLVLAVSGVKYGHCWVSDAKQQGRLNLGCAEERTTPTIGGFGRGRHYLRTRAPAASFSSARRGRGKT